jgi:excisionase family DNA binding protein
MDPHMQSNAPAGGLRWRRLIVFVGVESPRAASGPRTTSLLLGVSHEYVWQLSREGRIPTVCLGRTRRYRRESILAWLVQIESQGGRV